jgi:hypothetical protein
MVRAFLLFALIHKIRYSYIILLQKKNMTEIYRMSTKVFIKNMSIFTMMFLLWIFSLTQKQDDLLLFFCGIFLTALSPFLLYLCISQKKKKLLEISAKGIVITENIKLSWDEIQGFNLRIVSIKNKEIPMIDVYMNENWDSSSLPKRLQMSARINKTTWFWQFVLSPNQFCDDENELYQLLNKLLTMSEENREQYLSSNKYR